MAVSIRYSILDTLLKLLKGFSFDPQPGDGVPRIEPNAIVFRKVRPSASRDPQPVDGIDLPAIVVTTPYKTVQVPNTEGTNEDDQYEYRFLVQFIASETIQPDEANLQTYWAWQQLVARAFNNNVNIAWNHANDGTCVRQILVDLIDEIDEKQYVVFQNVVCGVELRFLTWQPRGFPGG